MCTDSSFRIRGRNSGAHESLMARTPPDFVLRAEEIAVCLVIRLFDKRISQLLQEVAQRHFRIGRYLEPNQDFSDVRSVITVVKERNIPIWLQASQEVGESTEPFWEF